MHNKSSASQFDSFSNSKKTSFTVAFLSPRYNRQHFKPRIKILASLLDSPEGLFHCGI